MKYGGWLIGEWLIRLSDEQEIRVEVIRNQDIRVSGYQDSRVSGKRIEGGRWKKWIRD